jgi:beta-glucoside operon transcriptional antiterminator
MSLRILKVFNNSVVLATGAGAGDGASADGSADGEVVLLGRGLGFQKAPGDLVDTAAIEKQFVPGGVATGDQLTAYLEEIPAADLALTQEIVAEARAELGSQVSDHVIFPLADHLSFALRRVREGIAMEYPLRWEVTSLYPREVAFARRALAIVARERGVELPAGEAVPLALHFVNAQFGAGEMAATVQVTDALRESLVILHEELTVVIDEDSSDTARFVTHLRFLIARRMNGKAVAAVDPAVQAALRTANAAEYATAGRIAAMLDQRFGWETGEDERLYLTIHVARLAASA